MNSTTLIETISAELLKAQHLKSNPIQNAWWLLEALTNKTRVMLTAQNKIVLSDAQTAKLHEWLHAIIHEHKPLQYVIGSVPFLDLTLHVSPPILIPRPETEYWCEQLINKLLKIQTPVPAHPLRILDLCTGTGCIGLAFAQALPNAQIVALDINPDAIQLAQENAILNKISNITFLKSDLFSALEADNTGDLFDLFDLIVSNPPYITKHEWEALPPHIQTWEDSQALMAQEEGLAIINQIIEQAPQYIRKNSILAQAQIPQLTLEIGSGQAQPVALYMKKHGYTQITVQKDLSGHDRVTTACLENSKEH